MREKLENLKQKQTKLNNLVKKRQANIIEALLLSQQYTDIVNEATNRFTRLEDLLQLIDEDKTKGIDVKKEMLKGLQDGVNQLFPMMNTMKETGNDLIGLSGPGEGADVIKAQIEEFEKRWEILSKRVEEKGMKLRIIFE